MKVNEQKQILTFQCSEQIMGVSIEYLDEIIENRRLTRVPGIPSYIRGLLNLRGTIVPVLDLKERLWQEGTEAEFQSCILVTRISPHGTETILGLLVDAVDQVIRLESRDINPPPDLGAVKAEYLEAVAKINNDFVLLLDPEMILSLSEVETVDEVVQKAAEQPQKLPEKSNLEAR